jgi:hypothetical protein
MTTALEGPNGLRLYLLRCNSCEIEWPCDILAWSNGRSAEDTTSKCRMPNCEGTVVWTGEEFIKK